MEQTTLLKEILKRADEVRAEFGSAHLCPSHVAAAVVDFCQTPYTGFTVSDMTWRPCRFEEERLRYLCAKEVRLQAYFRLCLKGSRKQDIREAALDLSGCQHIAALRQADVLSADMVFLWALSQLPEPYSKAVRTARSDEDILSLLQDTDIHIYDYVIEKIQEIRTSLQKKADEAAAIRDWKPAAKFTEPKDLAALFFSKIKCHSEDNILTLVFPKLFGRADLKVSIFQVNDIYYIHDNGCAVKHLSRQVADKAKRKRFLQKVCHPCWIDKNRITGSFVQVSSFLNYLQMLVFIAHADLFYTRLSARLYTQDKGFVFPNTKDAKPLDTAALLRLLKSGIGFYYDENLGITCWLDTRYSLGSGRPAYLLETLPGGHIRISDKKKDKLEGCIFESFYWDNDDIAPYGKFITRFADRFGVEFDGKNVFLTAKSQRVFPAMLKFFNLSVLLSELGHDIDLPKIRRKG